MFALMLVTNFAAAGRPPKEAEASKSETAKMRKDADHALAKIRQDKAKSKALDAAIKSRDRAKVRQILVENGIDVGPVLKEKGDICFRFQSRWLCITYGSHHFYWKD